MTFIHMPGFFFFKLNYSILLLYRELLLLYLSRKLPCVPSSSNRPMYWCEDGHVIQAWPITELHLPGSCKWSSWRPSLGVIYRLGASSSPSAEAACSLPHGKGPTGVIENEADRWKETE